MSGVAGMEYHRDIAGEKLYASRNHNNLRQTYQAPGANRTNVDWTLTLRQVRKPIGSLGTSSSAPVLGDGRQKDLQTEGHPDGPYHCESETFEKYQNFANTGHMLNGVVRKSSGFAPSIDWQLNLRGGLHRNGNEFAKWKRHFARPQVSFDMMKENCSLTNEEYQNTQVTPQDRRPDRMTGAIPVATMRDDPISFRKWPGCEGSQASQWRHLIECRRYGHKGRRQLQFETTLRENSTDKNGARIMDTRSDGCIMEMLGKKKWSAAQHIDPLAQRWPRGDPKLYHLANKKVLPAQDEENRRARMTKCPRTDANIPETHQAKARADFG